MAKHLLFVILICFICKTQTKDPPPELTVYPSVISAETDSVSLNCQPPSSASVSQCYFSIEGGETILSSSCHKTLTVTELLAKTRQSSPAEVKVKCFYTVRRGAVDSPSLHSSVVSIHIQTLSPPKLRVNPSVITETQSVTLICQTPPSVSAPHCYFYTVGAGSPKQFSCMETLTGSDLMSQQSSPAEVKVKCFYTVKLGELDYPSPHSDPQILTIQSHTPELSLLYFPGENVVFVCSLPGSANKETTCNLYFGDETFPAATSNIMSSSATINKQRFCQFSVTISDLLRRLYPHQQSHASCDYTLGSEPNTLSPRSERYNLTDIVESESSRATTQPALTPTTDTSSTSKLQHRTSSHSTSMEDIVEEVSQGTTTEPKVSVTTAGLPVGSTANFLSTSQMPVEATSEKLILKIIVGVTCFGVAVGVIFLGRVLTGTGRCFYKRTQRNVSRDFIYMDNVGSGGLVPAGKDQSGDVIAPEPDAVCPADTKEPDRKRDDNEEEYHTYYTIPDEPSPRAPNDNVYSLLQAH